MSAASLTFGMIVVFYPWIFRKLCELVVKYVVLRRILAWSFVVLGLLTVCTLIALGEVIGEVIIQ